jgi:hypothetical protein
VKAETVILSIAAVAIISAVATKAILERQTRRGTSEFIDQHPANSPSGPLSKVQKPRAVSLAPEAVSANAPGSIAANMITGVSGSTSNVADQKIATNSSGKEPLQDPIARVALTFVGMDPDAEDYWFAAINDLTLPANERQDLIEDLNEEGLEDPRHPTIDDLPLIINRLALIETIAPDAADQVNADAFMEAYKDLLNLAELAMGGGQPVR